MTQQQEHVPSPPADLAAFRRRFVRAKFGLECLLEGETTQADLDAEQDQFFTGIVCAEMAAHHNEIDCAACGSSDIVRMPLTAPWRFRTVTTETGHLYGYAVCAACHALDAEEVAGRVDEVFDRLIGRLPPETDPVLGPGSSAGGFHSGRENSDFTVRRLPQEDRS